MGELKLINAVADLIAAVFYQIFLKAIEFKKIYFWTSVLMIISQLSILIQITRYNLIWGITDDNFALVANFFIHLTLKLNIIPVLIFACRICPKNVEGTMYALIMALVNFSDLLSQQIAALVSYVLNITSTDFENLWIFVLIACGIIALSLPFVFFVKIQDAQEIIEKENKKEKEKDDQKNEDEKKLA